MEPTSDRDIWASTRESLTLLNANNKGADQPAHLRSLVSAFVIRFLESKNTTLATSKISIFLLVYVAEQTGLRLTQSTVPKTGLLEARPITKAP